MKGVLLNVVNKLSRFFSNLKSDFFTFFKRYLVYKTEKKKVEEFTYTFMTKSVAESVLVT